MDTLTAEGEASRYARMGYAVLPLVPGEKRPHPGLAPHGLKEASREEGRIREWWRACPRCGVGILAPEGVLVLDVDREGVWEGLRRDFPPLEAAPRQRTPKGGVHLFLRLPQGVRLSATVRALEGVDLRGMGRAYVVAAPTRLRDGRGYEWEVPLVPPEALPPVPEDLLLRLLPPRRHSRGACVVPRWVRSPRRLRALLGSLRRRSGGPGPPRPAGTTPSSATPWPQEGSSPTAWTPGRRRRPWWGRPSRPACPRGRPGGRCGGGWRWEALPPCPWTPQGFPQRGGSSAKPFAENLSLPHRKSPFSAKPQPIV